MPETDEVVLSVFYNGTDSNYMDDFQREGRFLHGELISRLGHAAVLGARAPHRALRVHGVGGSKRARSRGRPLLGTGFGYGMLDDVREIVSFAMVERRNLLLRAQARGVSAPQTLRVNLAGWSRGGVGCIYAAHLLSREWEAAEAAERAESESGAGLADRVRLDIRLVVMDPVSGKGTNYRSIEQSWAELGVADLFRRRTKWWELPATVTEFHGFYAHDERSPGFAATIPSMPSQSDRQSFHVYAVPGTHSTLVGNLWPNGGHKGGQQADPVGQHIYRRVVTRVTNLLLDWGTPLDRTATAAWLEPMGLQVSPSTADRDHTAAVTMSAEPAPVELLAAYRDGAQEVMLTFQFSRHILKTDGRGLFLGDNHRQRMWTQPDSLTDYRSMRSGWWSKGRRGRRVRTEQLAPRVVLHDFDPTTLDWT